MQQQQQPGASYSGANWVNQEPHIDEELSDAEEDNSEEERADQQLETDIQIEQDSVEDEDGLVLQSEPSRKQEKGAPRIRTSGSSENLIHQVTMGKTKFGATQHFAAS